MPWNHSSRSWHTLFIDLFITRPSSLYFRSRTPARMASSRRRRPSAPSFRSRAQPEKHGCGRNRSLLLSTTTPRQAASALAEHRPIGTKYCNISRYHRTSPPDDRWVGKGASMARVCARHRTLLTPVVLSARAAFHSMPSVLRYYA